MAPRGAGVSYSQARRNEEVAAREEARSLVPPKYFDAAVEADGKNNTTTKTLKGVIAYLKEIGGDTSSVDNATQQGSAGYVTATTNSQAGPINTSPPRWLQTDPHLRALQQAMNRLVQCIQTQAIMEGGMTEELTTVADQANDLLVDMIDNMGGGRTGGVVMGSWRAPM